MYARLLSGMRVWVTVPCHLFDGRGVNLDNLPVCSASFKIRHPHVLACSPAHCGKVCLAEYNGVIQHCKNSWDPAQDKLLKG